MEKEQKKGKLFVISGPSGVGKGTLLKKFLDKNENIKLSVSCTTRKPRSGEIEGINYFFLSEKMFKDSIENGEFLEWAKYSDHFYGTKKLYVEKKLQEGKNLILEIDTQGAFQVEKQIKDSILIFIMPPSFKELEKRLRGRNTEDESSIQKRLNFVKKEIENSKYFKYKIVNDKLESALKQLDEIFLKEKSN